MTSGFSVWEPDRFLGREGERHGSIDCVEKLFWEFQGSRGKIFWFISEHTFFVFSQASLYDFSAIQQYAAGQNAVAAAQAQAQAQYGALAAAAAANSAQAGQQQYADYAGVDLTSQQSAHGGYYVRRWA